MDFEVNNSIMIATLCREHDATDYNEVYRKIWYNIENIEKEDTIIKLRVRRGITFDIHFIHIEIVPLSFMEFLLCSNKNIPIELLYDIYQSIGVKWNLISCSEPEEITLYDPYIGRQSTFTILHKYQGLIFQGILF